MRALNIIYHSFVLMLLFSSLGCTHVVAREDCDVVAKQARLGQFKENLRRDSRNVAEIDRLIDLVDTDLPLDTIGKAFSDVANEFSAHDYPHIDENSVPLLVTKMEELYVVWQKWYAYKIVACYYFEKSLNATDNRLCDKGLTATEIVVPLDNPLRDEVLHQAEQLYGQQLKIKNVTDNALRKIGIDPSKYTADASMLR